ncbi:3-(3-hydroxy-phenyl)propionate hydroxylase [Paracoccus halophilus]|uniref:3-(3-hydroxy-phenyl)propionate hydroxylase n=1 Tax=Paracoccus halophilus TaxID=376733 RepID=A0A1I0TLK3_9RHOB|nr:FAD-dependent monooxygenase [Paracoccus halophilus]SFA52680.1 3-(3-hydroxy-phenyl)propionate hydroxylase [Paracoccus halophilus]
MTKPIIIAGAGPVGLMMALACKFYGLDFVLLEEDDSFSSDTKAGTILTRTVEACRRYGRDADVLARALRLDEIGELERATNQRRTSVRLDLLADQTRFPFVLNLPQHHFEPVLAQGLTGPHADVRLNHRVTGFSQTGDGVSVTADGPDGPVRIEGSYLIACDGGQSQIRARLGVEVEGQTLDVKYMLIDVKADLDVQNPRDYPYLAYFSDPEEWMILIRQPHCWRFLYPLEPGVDSVAPAELEAKVRRFVGDVGGLELLNTIVYRVHHRVATHWREHRVFLAGDAAHLITPMWALGMNTGVLDALNLPWRLAWVQRGWAEDALLDGYEREQRPLAVHGSGEMAEAARKLMGGEVTASGIESSSEWALAMTRSLLGVRLDVDGRNDWSIVCKGPQPVQPGSRMPDLPLFDGNGRRIHLHDLCDDSFVALHFTDARRKPRLPDDLPGLKNLVVSNWDAPLESGLRPRALLDVGGKLFAALGCARDTVVLLRPDDHVAAILPLAPDAVHDTYRAILRGG